MIQFRRYKTDRRKSTSLTVKLTPWPRSKSWTIGPSFYKKIGKYSFRSFKAPKHHGYWTYISISVEREIIK